MPLSSATPALRRVSRCASVTHFASFSTHSIPTSSSPPSDFNNSKSQSVLAALAKSPAAALDTRRARSRSSVVVPSSAPPNPPVAAWSSTDSPIIKLALSFVLSFECRTARRSTSTVLVKFSSVSVFPETASCGSPSSSFTRPMVWRRLETPPVTICRTRSASSIPPSWCNNTSWCSRTVKPSAASRLAIVRSKLFFASLVASLPLASTALANAVPSKSSRRNGASFGSPRIASRGSTRGVAFGVAMRRA
mmetsp:Transcript_4226/g.15564  ORF Transcript_4226/g.15564 Transcript_4226/m.15564 type:complete len:250 (-) Transcript_4226:15-764(-)